MAPRPTPSDFAHQAVRHGLADNVGLKHFAAAWHAWGQREDGWFAVLHGEVLARV